MHLTNISLMALTLFSLIFSLSHSMDLAYICYNKTSIIYETDPQEKSIGEVQLLEASTVGNTIGCSFLLESGVPVNTRNADGQTPLMLAASNSHLDTCKVLLQQGAGVQLTDPKGNSALSLAVSVETIKLLLEWSTQEHGRKLSGMESPPD